MRKLTTTNRFAFLLLLLAFGLVLFTGLRGMGFGRHWDEIRILESAINSWNTANPLPGWYNYPSVSHDLALVTQLSYWIDGLVGIQSSPEESLFIRARVLFIMFSSGSMILLFFLAKEVLTDVKVALLAACLLGFSFEFAYHSRWIAPDTLMAFFTLLSVWQSICYLHEGKRKALVISALAAGIATGCKYPGALTALPLALAILFRTGSEAGGFKGSLKSKRLWKTFGLAAGLGILVFLFLTPGAIFDTSQFLHDIRYEVQHYQEGHGRHTVNGFSAHAYRMLMYFGFHGFSSLPAFSLLCSAFVIPGIIYVIRKKKQTGIMLVAFPLVYMLYFMTQKAMIVRNYMVLIPFLAFFSAAGFMWLTEWISNRFRPALVAVWLIMGAGVVYNGFFIGKAAESIVRLKTPESFFIQLESWIRGHPQTNYVFSEGVATFWREQYRKPLPNNVVRKSRRSKNFQVVFFSREFPKYWRYYLVNRHNYTRKVIGSLDVNFNYYPEWPNEKIVLMDARFARKLPLTLDIDK
jgi:hypothetical protein